MVFAGVGTNENILAYTLADLAGRGPRIGWPTAPLAPRVALARLLAVHGYGLYRADSGHGLSPRLSLVVAIAFIEARPRFGGQAARRVLLAIGGPRGRRSW